MTLVVAERTQEVGVRLALGAAPIAVLTMIVRGALTLAGAGVAMGLGAAAGLAPLLSSQVFGIDVIDPLTFAVVPLLLLAVAVAASTGPARRAMRVDPVQAMRYE
jgi:ABC-type antimicrobial peptide transport system permease subunit